MYLSRLKSPVDFRTLKKEYERNKPFSHIVMDDFFNPVEMKEVESKFPESDNGSWWSYSNALERKFARTDLENFPFQIQLLIHELQSNLFVSFLEKLTGIDGLIVDHTLNGAGLHQSVRGGKLDLHVDYNYHPVTRLDRRVNVLVYLNSGWKPEWGGALELHSRNSPIVRMISPTLGRMVIFGTTDSNIHGHPDPLECPNSKTRKSIALYYYSNGRPRCERRAPHSTVFLPRPGEPLDPEKQKLRMLRAKKRLP